MIQNHRARYSPIAPIALLKELFELEVREDRQILGGYLLLLAHDVLKHPQSYKALMEDVRHRYNDDTFIIMDNSVVELGTALSVTEVIVAAEVVNANCIMAPDVLGSYPRTQSAVLEELDDLLATRFPIMMVPQGSSMNELLQCVDWLQGQFASASNPEPSLWGIPRWITNQLGTRSMIVKYINLTSESVDTRIHLLGMSKNFTDDMECTKLTNVIGIDSANPLVLGVQGLDMSKGPQGHYDRGDFWHNDQLAPLSIKNVEYMHSVVGD